MKPYLLIALLIITASCGYEEIPCHDGYLLVKLDNFTEEELDSVILETYTGKDFTTKIDRSLMAIQNNDMHHYGTNAFTLTFVNPGVTYWFSDIQYEGKKSERRKKVFDMGGSYRPTPCFNNVATVTLDGTKLFFDTRIIASVTLDRK